MVVTEPLFNFVYKKIDTRKCVVKSANVVQTPQETSDLLLRSRLRHVKDGFHLVRIHCYPFLPYTSLSLSSYCYHFHWLFVLSSRRILAQVLVFVIGEFLCLPLVTFVFCHASEVPCFFHFMILSFSFLIAVRIGVEPFLPQKYIPFSL